MNQYEFCLGVIFAIIIIYIGYQTIQLWEDVAAVNEPQVIKKFITTKDTPLEALIKGCKSLIALVVLVLLSMACLIGFILLAIEEATK